MRSTVSKWSNLLLLVLVPAVAATAMVNGNAWLTPTVASAVVASLALAAWRNVHEAAGGSRSMNQAMASVRANAESTSQSVRTVMEASGSVAASTQRLDATLSELLGGLRSNGS